MRELHYVDTPEGRRFCIWNTVSDCWSAERHTRDEAIAEHGEPRVLYAEADPERKLERWWLNAPEVDCFILGHCERDEPTPGRCGWCGHALYDVLG